MEEDSDILLLLNVFIRLLCIFC